MFIKRILTYCLCMMFSFNNICIGQQPTLVLPIGHSARINSGSFSPDGKMLLTVSEDRTVKIWEVESGFLLLDLTGNADEVNSACFSPDGKMIVTATSGGTVKLWDIKTGALIKNFIGHGAKVNSACFSPDGKNILTASTDRTVKIWDTNTGKLLNSLSHPHWVYSACFSPDGKKIATACEDRKAYIWEEETGSIDKVFEDTDSIYAAGITSVCFSPATIADPGGGKKILTASFDKTVKIRDVTSGKELMNFKGHANAVNSACFSADAKKILTASSDKTAIIWDAENEKILQVLKGHSGKITSACFSPDGKKILTTSDDHTAKIWDTETGKLLKDLETHSFGLFKINSSPANITIGSILADQTTYLLQPEPAIILQNLQGQMFPLTGSCLSADGKMMATTVESYTGNKGNFTVITRDVETGKMLYELKGHLATITSLCFSPDGKKILTGSFDGTAKIWDATNGILLVEMERIEEDKYIDKRISKARFSADAKKVVTGYYEGIARIWDAEGGAMLKELKKHADNIMDICFSPDAKKIATASTDNTVKVWNANSGALLLTLKKHSAHVLNVGFSPDGKKILTGSDDNTAKLWDAETGVLLHDLTGHSAAVLAFFSMANARDPIGGKWIFTKSGEGTIKKWDTQTGNCVYSFFAVDSSDYMLQIPSGYYQSTPNASKLLHYVTKDLKAIGFEQLDIKYNRPDKILEAIGNTDTAVISTYRNAYYKRIKKLVIDTTAFSEGYSLPETDIINRDNISRETTKETLILHIKGIDNNYKLASYNIWVNEVPVFGQRGISLSKNRSGNLECSHSISLSQGENRIETSVTNENGTESYRIPLTVNYTPENKQKEKVYFFGIGIDKFADTAYNLQYCTKDIRDLAVKLKEKFANDIMIDTLFNEKVTVANIRSLKKTLFQTTVNDKLIIYYSGHGLISKTFDYYLSTYSIKFDDPQEAGLAYEELENLLDSIPARKKLMLIDACHSGEIDKEDFKQVALNKAAMASDQVVSKGVIVSSSDASKKLGLKNSFELMQNLFVNVAKNTGATIISAAAGTEFALEKVDLKNGVFTYCMLEAMDKYPVMKISELKKIVGARVEELTKGKQRPTSRNENIAVDWNVW